MAWIPYADQGDDVPATLRELYQKVSPGALPDNILRIHSLNPPSLGGHLGLYRTLMRGRSPLSRAEREMIAVVVSDANDCHY